MHVLICVSYHDVLWSHIQPWLLVSHLIDHLWIVCGVVSVLRLPCVLLLAISHNHFSGLCLALTLSCQLRCCSFFPPRLCVGLFFAMHPRSSIASVASVVPLTPLALHLPRAHLTLTPLTLGHHTTRPALACGVPGTGSSRAEGALWAPGAPGRPPIVI